jgi:hypothetical protein
MKKAYLLPASAAVTLLLLITWFAHQPISAQDRPAPTLTKWEYKVMMRPAGHGYQPAKDEGEFNKLGADRWELCGTVVQSHQQSMFSVAFVFKRSKQ